MGTQTAKSKLPIANSIQGRLKSEIAISANKTENSKRMKVSSSYHQGTEADRLKLKEICFVKQNYSKKVIAKFMDTEKKDHDDDDDLIVAWEADYSPKILSTREGSPGKNNQKGEPSTSSKPKSRCIKTSSFLSNKLKRSKNNLHRLTTGDPAGKVDKMKNLKRKKKINLK